LHRRAPLHGRFIEKGFTDEAWLKGMEEARQTALEVAQEKDAPTEETAQAAEAVGLIPFILWEHGVVRYPRGLQLLSHSPSPVRMWNENKRVC